MISPWRVFFRLAMVDQAFKPLLFEKIAANILYVLQAFHLKFV
jgi:hypothetical protein